MKELKMIQTAQNARFAFWYWGKGGMQVSRSGTTGNRNRGSWCGSVESMSVPDNADMN